MKPEGGPARDLDFDKGTEQQAAMIICHSEGSAAKCRWLDNHHDDARRMLPRRWISRRDRPPTMLPPMSFDLLAQLDGLAVLFEEAGDHLLLSRQLA